MPTPKRYPKNNNPTALQQQVYDLGNKLATVEANKNTAMRALAAVVGAVNDAKRMNDCRHSVGVVAARYGIPTDGKLDDIATRYDPSVNSTYPASLVADAKPATLRKESKNLKTGIAQVESDRDKFLQALREVLVDVAEYQDLDDLKYAVGFTLERHGLDDGKNN